MLLIRRAASASRMPVCSTTLVILPLLPSLSQELSQFWQKEWKCELSRGIFIKHARIGDELGNKIFPLLLGEKILFSQFPCKTLNQKVRILLAQLGAIAVGSCGNLLEMGFFVWLESSPMTTEGAW